MTQASSRHTQAELLLLVLCSLLGVSLVIPSVSAIKCYQCNSFINKGCDDVGNGTTYLMDCKNDNETVQTDSEAYCRKMVQRVLLDGSTRIIRGCGWEKSRQSCYRTDDDDHSETVCQCFEEACNSAPGRLAALVSLTLLPVMLARL